MAHFLKEHLASFGKTGAVCPSSQYLANAMTDKKKLSLSKCVVELGPGTGAITEKILQKISRKCIFFALEINPFFAKTIEENFPSATLYLDSAANIQKYLQKHKTKHCDTVISSLPWAFFDWQTQTQIFESVYGSLSAGGKMITYCYLHGLMTPSGKRFRKLLYQHFPKINKNIVWKNLPPAIVYECSK